MLFMCLAITGYAQNARYTYQSPGQRNEYAKPLQNEKESDLFSKIDNINRQIENLRYEIDREYERYSNETRFNEDTLAYLDREKDVLRDVIKIFEDSIAQIEKDLRFDSVLRDFYSKDIDVLFTCTDLVSMQVHKRILGKNYPRVMDNLQILLECKELFKKEFNEKQNQAYQQKLNVVQQCEAKEHLSDLLDLHQEISADVDSWIKSEHSLYEMMLLYRDYSVTIDDDYPWLAAKIRKAVTQ